MAVMVTGASRTTTVTASEDGSTATDFGTGSPGWVATRINAVIAALASAPAKAIADQGSIQEQTQDPGDPLSCAAFTANMRANYQDLYLGGPANLGASVPLVMSQMWQNTGLMVWVNSQFGAGNPYGPRVFCHVLENRLNTTRWLVSNTEVPRRTDGFGPRQGSGNGTMLGLLLDANRSGVPGVNGDAPAWDFRGDDVVEDAAVIGWAACRWDGDWSVDPAWARSTPAATPAAGTASTAATPATRSAWTTAARGGPTRTPTSPTWQMNFEDNPGHIRAATAGAPAVGNFLTNWHGNDNSAAFALAFAFDLSSLIMLLVFGGIALGIIVAKVAMVVMIALLIVAMVASLWIGPGSTRLAAYAKFYVGSGGFHLRDFRDLRAAEPDHRVPGGRRRPAVRARQHPGGAVVRVRTGHRRRRAAPAVQARAAGAVAVQTLRCSRLCGRDRRHRRGRRGRVSTGYSAGLGPAANARVRQVAGGGRRTPRHAGRGRGSNAGSMPMRPPAPKQLDAGRSGAPPPALTAAEHRGAKRSLHTGQHLPPDRLTADTREWARPQRTSGDGRRGGGSSSTTAPTPRTAATGATWPPPPGDRQRLPGQGRAADRAGDRGPRPVPAVPRQAGS